MSKMTYLSDKQLHDEKEKIIEMLMLFEFNTRTFIFQSELIDVRVKFFVTPFEVNQFPYDN